MDKLNPNEKSIWSCWEEKSHREVVREAAAKGTYINLALQYLMHKNQWNHEVAKDWFNSEVKAWTIQLLLRKQIFKVLHILNKSQINPEDHLMTLALESTDIDYREFILENLEKIHKDMKSENIDNYLTFKKHCYLLKHLENSFVSEDGTFKQNKVFGKSKDRIVVTESEIKALTVDKIMKYPEEWKVKIATFLFFECFEFSLLEFSSSQEVWNYLLQHNKAMILVHWINVQMSEVVRDMNARYNFFNKENFVTKLKIDSKNLNNEIMKKLDSLFRQWCITDVMIQSINTHNCFDYTKLCIYDTFCSYGVVNSQERNNVFAIISRLARTENLKVVDDIFIETCATMTKRDFYVEMAKYLVKNKLYKVLTICVEEEVLGNDFSDVEQEARECIELWLSFKAIEYTADRQSHVVPVYKTCEQIARKDIDNYISDNPYLVVGMILLEDNAKLFDILSNDEFLYFKDFKLPNKGYIDRLPHLYNVYKNFIEINQSNGIRDVNVYQLLSGYRGLDVLKIFEFQMIKQNINSFGNEKSDRRSLGSLLSNDIELENSNITLLPQKLMEMPHFANEKLMKRYGHVAKLNHMYYLKQFRPCHGSQAFVAQQYLMYNRLQDKSIKNACCEAHALAIQNWNDPAMTACAVSFVAMIGCNPARCRVHMSVAKTLKCFKMKENKLTEEQAVNTINEYMTKLLQNSEYVAKEILGYLEKITLDKVKRQEKLIGKVDMAYVLYESQTMVKFALLHNLPLPELQLREFIKNNSWFNFLAFGDVFRYPLNQMLQLTQEFENKSYAEHMKYIMLHRNVDEGSDKDLKSSSGTLQRKLSRLSSNESPTRSGVFEFPEVVYVSRELWEVAAACHGPEDPPGALVRAAGHYHEPLFALIATCYEPNAVGVLWAYWVLATLNKLVPDSLRDTLQWDISQQHPTDEEFQTVAELCLRVGFVRTLHESLLIFFPESPLAMLTAFLCRSIWQKSFDMDSTKLLLNFMKHCLRKYSTDSALPWALSKQSLQNIAISLIIIAISQCFDSALHQKQFLKCVVDSQFGKDFTVACPDFMTISEILQLSMETTSVIDVSKLFHNDSAQYLSNWIEMYTTNKNYDVALKIAKLANLPVNSILIEEWKNKLNMMINKEDAVITDKDWTLYIAQCSEAFKMASVTFDSAVDFLESHVSSISDSSQKFYAYRIIMSWFQENREYGQNREKIEHLMWDTYLESKKYNEIFLNNHQSTLHYILNGQKDQSYPKQLALLENDKPFASLLSEIEIESDIANVENVILLEDQDVIDVWRKALHQLLELKLLVDAFRLSALYTTNTEFKFRPPACPVNIVRTCLKLAEGLSSPYELPQDLRLVISSPYLQHKLTSSETSDVSFEELVIIQEKQDNAPHLAVREDADRLSALEALAARSGLTVAKQIANYFRISLQIGWNYNTVLKYQNDPMDFINYVSGRARMSLANLIFRTFNISSKQIADFLCQEMVSAIICPHLIKTSSFRQKEHFQYTLWGYMLNSDIEMFLNMRPDACSHIGRLILDHLMAFRRIYKYTSPVKVPDNFDDTLFDVESLIDDEYQNVEESEVESLNTQSSATDGGTITSGENESVLSVSTVYSIGNQMARETRRNLFDIISKNKVHIPYAVKSNIRKITKGAKLSTKHVNIISIELLVLAHECFSCACDTEGVAVVLKSAQALISQLLSARSWRLMVRLLTGLARYTEMAYVFKLLRDNHQFEFLLGQFDYMLGQQQDKITEFKQGLMEFLKNHCPGDTETYIMVALHFNMYAEAANVKKKQAIDLINDLEKMALDAVKAASKKPYQHPEWLQIHDNVTTRSVLETALNHCTDASELFLQGGCMGFAGEMADLTQQIALQISLLNASPTRLILRRSSEQVYKLVSEYLSFMEGLVLMVGRSGSQWRELAYRRVLSNDQAYLRDMAAYRPDIAAEFLNRYKTEKKSTTASTAAMKELQALCR